jgi:hypothetical protein
MVGERVFKSQIRSRYGGSGGRLVGDAAAVGDGAQGTEKWAVK